MSAEDANALLASVNSLSSSMKLATMSVLVQQGTLDKLQLTPAAVQSFNTQKQMVGQRALLGS